MAAVNFEDVYGGEDGCGCGSPRYHATPFSMECGRVRRETMLDKLKRLDLEKIDLDEAVYLVSIGDSMKDVYLTGGLEVPQWLTDNVRELNREIANRMAESREKALREVELELVSLRTREEKRADLEAKANRLRATLGRPVGEPAKQ